MEDLSDYILLGVIGALFMGGITPLLKTLRPKPSFAWENAKAIEECLNHVNVDYLPFHDVYRSIYGFKNATPSSEEIENTFKLFSFLVKEKGLVPILGPEMKTSNKDVEDVLHSIEEVIKSLDYEYYNYGIWLDMSKKDESA